MAREIVIYCDESIKDGRFFSNFYGGALVESVDLMNVNKALNDLKASLNMHGEVKFQKVTENYLDKYMTLMDGFFDLIAQGKVKVRIMFTQNYHVAVGLDTYHKDNHYFLLYYQFIKHAFGLRFSKVNDDPTRLRLYFDELPDTKEKAALFKSYIKSLELNSQFKAAKICIPDDQIAEVKSHDHVILQCLDVVLGCMQFYLNDKHKEKPAGQFRRGKRTVAKEKLYRHIYTKLAALHKNFNVGISTGKPDGSISLWTQPYRHWLFIPKEYEVNEDSVKSKK